MVVVLPALLALAIAAENANDAGDKTNVGNFKLPEDAKWLDHMLLTFLQDPWAYVQYLAMFAFLPLCISMWPLGTCARRNGFKRITSTTAMNDVQYGHRPECRV